MKATNCHWAIRSPFCLYNMPHLCPDYGGRLNAAKRAVIMRMGKAKMRGIDLCITGGPNMIGNVKVIRREFECPQCGRTVSVGEMKRLEGIPK